MKPFRLLLACAALWPAAAAGQPPLPATQAAPPPRHTAADVRFMQDMIAHHAQAVRMAALVSERTNRQDIRLLAEKIDVSQQDEIAWMRTWLADRGGSVPAAEDHAHHDAGGRTATAAMPGMLTDEELAKLEAARGGEFDRLFLTYMIRHHEGALTMVKRLFGTPGAAQETRIFEFATEVDADQQAEIDRMRAILRTLPGNPDHS